MALSLKVLNGTPRHGDSLCFSCQQAHIIQGQAVSDLTVLCTAQFDHPRQMHRPVAECNEFRRKDEQSRNEMEKIAWILETKRGKVIGFVSGLEHKHRLNAGEVDDPDQ